MTSSEQTNVLTLIGLFINGLLLIATCFLAYYAFGQWRAVDKTLAEIKAQTPAVLESAKAAADSAAIAKSVADSSDAATKATLAEMRKQSLAGSTVAAATNVVATTAVKQLNLSERPLLIISNLKVPFLTINSFSNISYSVDVETENKGRSPSTDTALLTDLIIEAPGAQFRPKADIEKVCHSEDKLGPLSGILVPPTEKTSLQQSRFSDGATLRPSLEKIAADSLTGGRQLNARLVVCLVYRSPISKDIYHTGLLYQLFVSFTREDFDKIKSGSISNTDPIVIGSDRLMLRQMDIINGWVD